MVTTASDLTERQQSVLSFIIDHQQQHHMAPTVREICAHLGLTGPAGIHRILNILKDRGYLVSDLGKKRSWRFSRELPGQGIPMIGAIAAGTPIEAVENFEEELPISPALFGCETCFGLKVTGDSMIEAHIMDGDIAIIRPRKQVETGEIAAVIVEGLLPEATLKRVRRTPTALILEAANPVYAPLVFNRSQGKHVSIIGKLVGVVRREK